MLAVTCIFVCLHHPDDALHHAMDHSQKRVINNTNLPARRTKPAMVGLLPFRLYLLEYWSRSPKRKHDPSVLTFA